MTDEVVEVPIESVHPTPTPGEIALDEAALEYAPIEKGETAPVEDKAVEGLQAIKSGKDILAAHSSSSISGIIHDALAEIEKGYQILLDHLDKKEPLGTK